MSENVTDNRIGPNFGKPLGHRACNVEIKRLTDLLAERDAEVARLRDALAALADAAAPFAERMRRAVEHQEQWRADHPGQMAPLLNTDSVPSWWTYTPLVGEARRVVAALKRARAALAGGEDDEPPYIPPLASFPATIIVGEIRQGEPLDGGEDGDGDD